MDNPFPSHLSDDELTVEVNRLARSAREATAALVAHLVEFDARRLYLGAGFQSLFTYCREILRLSEHGTYNRIEAGRAVRQFPVILEMLKDGSLNLATVRVLAPHLTLENHSELLAAAHGRSKREVEALIAGRFPRPDVPTLVRKMPVRAVAVPALVGASASMSGADSSASNEALDAVACPDGSEGSVSQESSAPQAEGTSSSTGPASGRPDSAATRQAASARPTVMPLAVDRYQIRFTASAETYEKLRQAQELLGHSVPTGDVATVVDRALSALIADLSRKKLAATDRPRSGRRASSGSRHIPAEVRRTVWQRDEGRCAFAAADGRRCSARKPLEFHHVHPYAAGGEATVGNIELRCRSHNAYEAELFYGPSTSTRPGASWLGSRAYGESVHGGLPVAGSETPVAGQRLGSRD